MKNISVFWVIVTALFLTACGGEDSSGESQPTSENQNTRPVLRVEAYNYSFMAPDTISSGWVTLSFKNARGMEVHELGLAKLPDGKNFADYLTEIFPPWQSALEKAQNGDIQDSEISSVAYEMLPEWNSDIQYVKSRGLISGGHQVENIMNLEPGTYVIECWVKTKNGEIHISRGMIRPLTVVDTGNNASAPEPDYEITVGASGVKTSGELTTGKHMFSLGFELNENDQLVYDDVHLIRVSDSTDLAQVADWLPWYKAGGLRAPEPAEFFGGADAYGSIPEGGKTYFSIDVPPGRYAWIVQAPSEEEIWHEFTVDSEN